MKEHICQGVPDVTMFSLFPECFEHTKRGTWVITNPNRSMGRPHFRFVPTATTPPTARPSGEKKPSAPVPAKPKPLFSITGADLDKSHGKAFVSGIDD